MNPVGFFLGFNTVPQEEYFLRLYICTENLVRLSHEGQGKCYMLYCVGSRPFV